MSYFNLITSNYFLKLNVQVMPSNCQRIPVYNVIPLLVLFSSGPMKDAINVLVLVVQYAGLR